MPEIKGPKPGEGYSILYPTQFLSIAGPGKFGNAELMSATKDVWAEPKDADEDDEVCEASNDTSEFLK